jgi:hypothetical protein
LGHFDFSKFVKFIEENIINCKNKIRCQTERLKLNAFVLQYPFLLC